MQGLMCKLCALSYDRYQREQGDGTVYDSMLWAAKRARHFARPKRRSRPKL